MKDSGKKAALGLDNAVPSHSFIILDTLFHIWKEAPFLSIIFLFDQVRLKICYYDIKLCNLLKVIWLPCVPVAVGHWPAGGHPEELSLLGLVGAWRPEVLMSHSWSKKGRKKNQGNIYMLWHFSSLCWNPWNFGCVQETKFAWTINGKEKTCLSLPSWILLLIRHLAGRKGKKRGSKARTTLFSF